MNLETFNNNGIELIINTDTGETFSTERGYARMSGMSQQAINKRTSKIEPTTNKVIKGIQIHTPQGLRLNNLITEDLICEWLPKDNPDMATELLKVGVRMFLHQLAGYKVISTAVQPLDNTQDMFCKMMEMMQNHNNAMLSEIQTMKQDIASLKETKVKYDNIQTNVSFRYDNLYLTIRQYEYEELTQKLLESAQGNYFTVKDWLKDKRIYLDRGQLTKFGRLVADSYKSMVGREPNTKGKSNIRVYFDKDKDLLQMCLRQLMSN